MNHTVIVQSMAGQLALARNVTSTGKPFVLGETNSLYNQGRPGLSNTFGAAHNVSRVHMH
jgi:hypothetical protein